MHHGFCVIKDGSLIVFGCDGLGGWKRRRRGTGFVCYEMREGRTRWVFDIFVALLIA